VAYLDRAGRKAAMHSAHREAVTAFEQALVALGHLPESRETLEHGIELRCSLDFELFLLGEISRAREMLAEAEPRARALGDLRRLGEILARLGDRTRVMGERDRATIYFRQALDIAAKLKDLGLEVYTKFHMALAHHFMGDYRHAVTLYRENIFA